MVQRKEKKSTVRVKIVQSTMIVNIDFHVLTIEYNLHLFFNTHFILIEKVSFQPRVSTEKPLVSTPLMWSSTLPAGVEPLFTLYSPETKCICQDKF